MYLERATDRQAAAQSQRIDAVRSGMIFAYDAKAFKRWLASQGGRRGAVTGQGGGGLTGDDLERVLSAMLVTHPDIVAVRVH